MGQAGWRCICACAVLVPVLAGCSRGWPGTGPLPPLGQGRTIEPGVRWYEVALTRSGVPMRLWIYVPEKPPAGRLPCVFVAPAGSRLFHGMALNLEDRPEHLPYARAGFAVVAYELDGPLSDSPSDNELLAAARAFRDAHGGLDNARAAIDYALKRVPGIDSKRLYTAGHSSAATVSLLVAEKDPRIAACIAYAPVCYLGRHLSEEAVAQLDGRIPGFRDFLVSVSPAANAASLRCPTFIFHADDDSVVPLQDNAEFVSEAAKSNPRVTFDRVPSGDHHDSMINEGTPHAIAWLRGFGPAGGGAR